MTEIIIVPSLDENQRKKEYAITLAFDNRVQEKYTINTKPATTSKLVLESEALILNNLSVHEVVKGLDHAANLMYLTYNALAARRNDPLQATVSGLQKSLLDATMEASVTVGVFRTKSSAIIEDAFSAYRWLVQGKESIAIRQLQRCGQSAGEMANEANKLAVRFQAIGNSAQEAAQQAILTKVADENAKKQLLEKLNATKVLQAKTQELQKNLEQDLTAAQKEYEEAREREKVEGERAFATGLVGAIFGALATGVGAAAQAVIAIKSPIGLPGGYVPPNQPNANQQSAGSQVNVSGAEQQKQSLSEQLKQKEAEKTVVFQEKQENEKKIKAAEGKLSDPNATPDMKKQAEAEKQAAEAKRADIDARLAKAEEAVKTVLSGLSNVSQQLQQLSAQSHSAAETASKQKMAYYEHRNQLAAENRKALADLAAYSVEIKYTLDDNKNIVTAIKSLQFAIEALGGVVAALKNTELFWRNMANYCQNNLNNPAFVEDLAFMQSAFTLEERKDYYSSVDFLKGALGNLAQWIALNNVCVQYLQAVNEVYSKVNKNVGNPPSDDKAAAQVNQLAIALLDSAKKELAAAEEEIAYFEREKQALRA
jgi:hypothetical protein